jgi:hypothetical protein
MAMNHEAKRDFVKRIMYHKRRLTLTGSNTGGASQLYYASVTNSAWKQLQDEARKYPEFYRDFAPLLDSLRRFYKAQKEIIKWKQPVQKTMSKVKGAVETLDAMMRFIVTYKGGTKAMAMKANINTQTLWRMIERLENVIEQAEIHSKRENNPALRNRPVKKAMQGFLRTKRQVLALLPEARQDPYRYINSFYQFIDRNQRTDFMDERKWDEFLQGFYRMKREYEKGIHLAKRAGMKSTLDAVGAVKAMKSQTRPARAFGREYDMVQNDMDLRELRNHVGNRFWRNNWGDVTGAFVKVGNGEYDEIWVTESSRPYDNSAMYEDATR